MPKLVRLYIHSIAVGFAIAAAFVGWLLWSDVAGVGHLVLGSDVGVLAAVMLVVFHGIVFSGVQFAVRVMDMAERDEPPSGGKGQTLPALVPAPVPARAARRK